MATKLTPAQRDASTAWAANKFKELTPEFYPHPANAAKLMDFITEQLGKEYLEDYPVALENFQAAFAYVNREWILIQRPESEESKAQRAREAQKQTDADNRLINHAAEVQTWVDGQEKRLRELPIKDLRTEAIQQRNSIKKGEIERTSYRNAPASRVVDVSDLAAARTRVLAKGIKPNTQEFNHLVQEELANPQGLDTPGRREVSSQERQAARYKIALANPTMHRDSMRFNELVNAELNRA